MTPAEINAANARRRASTEVTHFPGQSKPTFDAFNESDHPRGSGGQFGGGSGGKSSPSAVHAGHPVHKLAGAKTKAAVAEIAKHADAGNHEGVAGVSTSGTHPLVAHYKEAVQRHMGAQEHASRKIHQRP